MSHARRAVRQAVRTVVESLEDRRLLASAVIGWPTLNGVITKQSVPVTLGPANVSLNPAVQATNFVIQNLSDPDAQERPASAMSQTGDTVRFTLSTPGNPIASGWHDAYFRHAGITDGESHANFAFLNGDFDGNGDVSINDFNILSVNMGATTGKKYAEGDADFDGGVSINDYNLMAANFGRTLPDPPTVAGYLSISTIQDFALDLTWEALDDEPRDGFKIYRSDDNGQTYNVVKTIEDPWAYYWRDTGLTAGKKYYYRFRGYTEDNGAQASVSRAFGVPVDSPPQPGDLWATGIGNGNIWVEWEPATNKPVAHYRVYRGTTPTYNASTYDLAGTTDDSIAQFTDIDREVGQTYYYTVIAEGTNGKFSLPLPPVAASVENEAPVITSGADQTTTAQTATVSVTATDDGYASPLTYAWSLVSKPDGAGNPLFQYPNQSSTPVTFDKAGYYELDVTVSDGMLTTNYTVSVDVKQTPQNLSIDPESVEPVRGDTVQFTAIAADQFSDEIEDLQVDWSADNGTIDSNGSYVADGDDEDATIRAEFGTLSATAEVHVSLPAPTGLTATAANEQDINLEWADTSNGETGFTVTYYETVSGLGTATVPVPPNATGWTIHGLSPNTSYTFTITAKTDGDLQSDVSAEAEGVTDGEFAPHIDWLVGTSAGDMSSPGKAEISGLTPDQKYRLSFVFRPHGSWDGNAEHNIWDSQIEIGPDSFMVKQDDSPRFDYTICSVSSASAGVFIDNNYESYDGPGALSDYRPMSWEFVATDESTILDFIQNSRDASGQAALPYETWEITDLTVVPLFTEVSIVAQNAAADEVPLASTSTDKLTFKVSRTEDDGEALEVPFHPPAGYAVSEEDYSGISNNSVTIPAGEDFTLLTLTTVADSTPEKPERVDLAIQANSNYRLGNYHGTGMIGDVGIDLSIDSNNDGTIDPTPDGPDDKIEFDPAFPGKYVDIDNYDSDGDHIPGFADGYSLTGAGPGNQIDTGNFFTPLLVTIPSDANLDTGTIIFTYEDSYPDQVTFPPPPGTSSLELWDYKLPQNEYGMLRLWSLKGEVHRSPAPFVSVTDQTKGNFIDSGAEIPLKNFGFSDTKRTIEIYVEAVGASPAGYVTQQPISVTYKTGFKNAQASDTVNVTAVYNRNGWRAIANKEANFSLRNWNPLAGYTSANRYEWRKIYEYYGALYNADYARNNKGATLGQFQWMGLAKVAGRQFIEAADLMGNVGSTTNGAASFYNGLVIAYNALPSWAQALPRYQMLSNASHLSAAALSNLAFHLDETQKTLMEMAFEIFNDAAWQHVAYRDGGIAEIRRLGDKDDNAIPGPTRVASGKARVDVLGAWELIAQGGDRNIWLGNRELINNEQNVTLARGYQIFRGQNMLDPVAPGIPGMTKAAAMTLGSKKAGPAFAGADTFWDFYSPYQVLGVGSGPIAEVTDDRARYIFIKNLWMQWSTPSGGFIAGQAMRHSNVAIPVP